MSRFDGSVTIFLNVASLSQRDMCRELGFERSMKCGNKKCRKLLWLATASVLNVIVKEKHVVVDVMVGSGVECSCAATNTF